MGKSWKIKPGARQDQPTVNRGWQLWNFDPGWGTGGPTGQRVNGSRVLTLALWPCLWIRYLNKPLTRALEAWVFGLGPRSVRSRSSSTLISGPSLGRWRVCSDRGALLSWAPAHPCPPPLSGLSLPALPLRAAPSAPWPLPSLVARPWQVGQPRPTRETVNPCRREGSRAASEPWEGAKEWREVFSRALGVARDRVATGVHPRRCNGSFSASCIRAI